VLLIALASAALVVATDLWALRVAHAAGRMGLAGGALALRGAGTALSKFKPSEDLDEGGLDEGSDDDEQLAEASKKEPKKKEGAKAAALALALQANEEPPQDPRVPVDGAQKAPSAPEIVAPAAPKGRKAKTPEEKPSALVAAAPPSPVAPKEAKAAPKVEPKPAPAAAISEPPPTDPPAKVAPPTIVEPKAVPKPAARGPEPRAQSPEPAAAPSGPIPGFRMSEGHTAFVTPPISILTGEAQAAGPIDRDGLTATAEKLRQKLLSFGIQGQVTQIRPGPVVTMFEFLPAPGIKVSRIAALADDLAMAMEALRVRIVAPIPGKGVVGIEIPNRQRQTVVLRELVEQEAFLKSQSKLAMCLGKDIEGMPYIADLAKMPHLLIAGTTGSGKSVAVNSMIVSMLLRASPEEVRFLMVDPKMLELSVYEGIPHLLLPVVTDAKKAAMALRWGVEEMERRYQLLAECGVRNIGQYNKKVEKEGDNARKPQPKAPKEKRVVDLTDASLDVHDLQQAAAAGLVERNETDNPAVQLLRANERKIAEGALTTEDDLRAQGKLFEPQPEPLRKLPYLVIIIDELADLMMVASREVETYIARLAQMARAAGIHLMVATQRPSTDVVTGVIKANFPARISFQVASRHDSATIINTPGAENLLGMGDMLILPPGTSALTRVHGPYVDEKEIHDVVEHWKSQGAPVYDPNILKPRAEDGEGAVEMEDEGPDELYDQAIASLADMRFISISLLQRKLRVGYNRAARMIERMERDGIVGPADGAKPREVLIRPLGEMPGA
jgi:S-DNA-T family DNA segregation ATPase FtsK/SpoIIIE